MNEFGYDSFGKQWVPPSGGAPSGPIYDPTAQALFSRFTTEPTTARKDLINDRIIAGKASTWWAKLDAIWVHAAHAPEAARLNWLGDFYNCVPVNNPAFEVDRGYRGNGTTSYLDTQFNPVTAVNAKFTQHNASFGVRSNDNNQASGSLAGYWDGSKGNTINPRDNSNKFHGRVNQTSGKTFSDSFSSIGMFVANRLPGNTIQGFMNGTRVYSDSTTPPSAMANGALRIGAISNTSLRACQFSMGFVGGGMTEQELADLFNWFEVYRIAVGVV